MDTLILYPPAKINLYLEIIGKRSDSYHEVLTLMEKITLHDRLSLSFGRKKGINLSCSDSGLPCGEENLITKAARFFFEYTGIEPDVEIYLKKNIPVGGGLGGGSSDAAATLNGLNNFFLTPVSQKDIIRLASLTGADSPFFASDYNACIARGRGDNLEGIERLPEHYILLIKPPDPVNTGWAYANVRLGLTRRKDVFKIRRFRKGVDEMSAAIFNDLENAVEPKRPDITFAKTLLIKEGAKGAMMSGSGACVFGLFSERLAAEKAGLNISQKTGWDTYVNINL